MSWARAEVTWLPEPLLCEMAGAPSLFLEGLSAAEITSVRCSVVPLQVQSCCNKRPKPAHHRNHVEKHVSQGSQAEKSGWSPQTILLVSLPNFKAVSVAIMKDSDTGCLTMPQVLISDPTGRVWAQLAEETEWTGEVAHSELSWEMLESPSITCWSESLHSLFL